MRVFTYFISSFYLLFDVFPLLVVFSIFQCFCFCHFLILLLLSAPSLRLTYKDLEQQRKKEEQKLKGLEGKKKEQAERLGMGLGMRRYDVEETNTSFCSQFENWY